MATQIKHFSLVLLVSLLAATCFSCASASDLRGFGGGRKLLQRLSGIALASNDVVASQEVRELKGLETLVDINVDYTPANTHPPDYDYPPPGEYSSKSVGFHTYYAPATTHPPDNDYSPPGKYSSKTVGFHTDYAPVTTHPPDYDYTPPGEYGSKTVGFHTDYASVTTHPPDYDYPPPGISSSIET